MEEKLLELFHFVLYPPTKTLVLDSGIYLKNFS